MSALPGPDGAPPLVGIVGHAGAYGRWLSRFFVQRMGLRVLGSDTADPASPRPDELARQVDVLVFCVPIRSTVQVIEHCIARCDGSEAGTLWLDLTSIKQTPVDAMLASCAEVAGLHPMAAPPKIDTLQGRTLAVCRARIARWQPWLDGLLAALRADCVEIAPAAHDRAMALVQGLVQASHLAQADVLRQFAAPAGGMPALHALRTVGHELDITVTGRILAGNPAIYEDIQFCNPDVLPVLERLADATAALRDRVADGGDTARAELRERFLRQPADWFGAAALAARSHGFERIGYLQADLEASRFLSVYLPEDRPGSLRELLAVFERLGVNLASIHSSRTADGQLHFRIGLDPLPIPLAQLRAQVEDAGIGRVLEARDDNA
jgi:prephenate dehydrogenase